MHSEEPGFRTRFFVAGLCTHPRVAQPCAEGHPSLCGLLSHPNACLRLRQAAGNVTIKLSAATARVMQHTQLTLLLHFRELSR